MYLSALIKCLLLMLYQVWGFQVTLETHSPMLNTGKHSAAVSFLFFSLVLANIFFFFNTVSEWEFYKPIAYREIVSY